MATELDKGTRVPWGEVEDVEDELALPDDDNYTIFEEIKTNDKGQKVKITRKIRKVRVVNRVNKTAEMRRAHWRKYGDAVDRTYESTTSKGDILEFEYEKVGKKEKKSLEEQIKKEVAETLARAAGKTPGAWTARRLAAQEAEAGTMRAPGGARIPAATGAYVPPGRLRGEEITSIRVSNLSEEVEEDELRALFEQHGTISRFHLLRDKVTGASKNIAFVTYITREQAEYAMKKLSGKGLHHLILQLEWAKPNTSSYGK